MVPRCCRSPACLLSESWATRIQELNAVPTLPSPQKPIYRGDENPNILIKSLKSRARPSLLPGWRKTREARRPEQGPAPSHPKSSPPAAHQSLLLCPQNTSQKVTLTMLVQTAWCWSGVMMSQHEQDEGELTSKTPDSKRRTNGNGVFKRQKFCPKRKWNTWGSKENSQNALHSPAI